MKRFLVTKGLGWVEACKWLGFIGMVADHGHTAGLWTLGPWWHAAGRLAFPLFVLAFSYAVVHLAAFRGEIRWCKLFCMGAIAQIAFPFAFGLQWWALNILFVFLAGWLVWRLACRGKFGDWIAVFILLGTSWPLFKAYSYGVAGPVCVALALSAWSQNGSNRVVVATIAFFIWLSTTRIPSLHLTCLMLLVVAGLIALRKITLQLPRISFAAWYVGHLFVIAGLKQFLLRG
jgi:hypothetical protein